MNQFEHLTKLQVVVIDLVHYSVQKNLYIVRYLKIVLISFILGLLAVGVALFTRILNDLKLFSLIALSLVIVLIVAAIVVHALASDSLTYLSLNDFGNSGIFQYFFLFSWGFPWSEFECLALCLEDDLSVCDDVMFEIICTVEFFKLLAQFSSINVLSTRVLSLEKSAKGLWEFLKFIKHRICMLDRVFIDGEIDGFENNREQGLCDMNLTLLHVDLHPIDRHELVLNNMRIEGPDYNFQSFNIILLDMGQLILKLFPITHLELFNQYLKIDLLDKIRLLILIRVLLMRMGSGFEIVGGLVVGGLVGDWFGLVDLELD